MSKTDYDAFIASARENLKRLERAIDLLERNTDHPIILEAIRVFGTHEKAFSWLTSNNRLLDRRTPVEEIFLGSPEKVRNILGAIEYGVYL